MGYPGHWENWVTQFSANVLLDLFLIRFYKNTRHHVGRRGIIHIKVDFLYIWHNENKIVAIIKSKAIRNYTNNKKSESVQTPPTCPTFFY